MERVRLAVVTTHPIQYYAPVFKLIAERCRIDIKVFYTWERGASSLDEEFGKEVEWDIPLLDGYDYEFVSNGGSFRKDLMGVRNHGLETILDRWSAEAVLVISWDYLSHLRVMRHFKGRLPVLFRGDSTLLDPIPTWKKVMRKAFLRFVYSHVDKALYVGTRSRDYFRWAGIPDKGLVYSPHAVDNERFHRTSEEGKGRSEEMRRALGIAPEDTVFLFAGKFIPKKDPLTLILSFLDAGLPNGHLVMVGDGQLSPRMQEVSAGRLNVHFLPFTNQSEMPYVYGAADVLCLPSIGPGETWGLAVNEAMACGKAVLVSDRVGCAVDLVVDGRNGFYFRAGDRSDLKEKLLRMGDTDLVRRMGSESLKRIQGWTFEAVAASIENAVLAKP
jgi:glycosyltransferase involved in cell wall biosynthesis